MWPDSLPSAHHPGDLLKRGAQAFRVTAHPLAEEDARDGTALEQDEIERQARNVASSKSNDQVPALPRDRAQRRFAVETADGIENDVDPVLAAQVLKGLAQVSLGVVDGFVCSVRSDEGKLLIAPGAGDHARAHEFPEFDGCEPDTARGAKHHKGLAILEAGTVHQRVVGSSIGHGEAGGAFEIEGVRELEEPLRRNRCAFACCASR